MIKWLLGWFFLALVPTSFLEQPGQIASENASYDGESLSLEGHVCLDHGLGQMRSQKAVLTKEVQEDASFPFSHIELEASVKLDLQTNAQLTCEKAILDFHALKGTLSSPSKVHYQDAIQKQEQRTSFELFTPYLEIQMVKDPLKEGAYQIDRGIASQGVHVVYENDYHMQAESICLSQKKLTSLPGYCCTWSHKEDQITAEQFELDTFQNLLMLKRAEGSLTSFSSKSLKFKTDEGFWNHQNNTLLLQGSPSIHDSVLGHVLTDKRIGMTFKEDRIHLIQAEGNITLESTSHQILRTKGSIEIDGDQKIARVTPSSKEDLIYEEEEMILTASQATLHYQEHEGRLTPSYVEMKGPIKICSKEKEGATRRGIADFVIYDPVTRKAILKAAPGKSVLFMRDPDGFKMSAPEIHISYDPVTHQQRIQGVGKVNFSLSSEEQSLLNKVFAHVIPSHKS